MKLKPLVRAGVLLGIGLGGFVDGILLHQILQTHNMLSARLPPTSLVNAEINMFWDGLFHAFTWFMTFSGIMSLWKLIGRSDVLFSTKAFFGSMVLGWGLFNFIEGIVDHHLLGVHHVVEYAPYPDQLYYDMGFLAFGVLQIIGGSLLISYVKKNCIQGSGISPNYL